MSPLREDKPRGAAIGTGLKGYRVAKTISPLRKRISTILKPPDALNPSEWAERFRVLRRGQSPRPGPWRNEHAPYLVGIMNLCATPGVEQVNVIKAGQIGVSEAIRNVIGWAAQQDPDPCGITLPNQLKGRQIVDNRLLPMFRTCAPLKALLTDHSHDLTKSQIKLDNGFILHLMWAGSAAATASDPIKRVFNDEVDKFTLWTGRESHPVENTRTRMRAYRDRGAVQINISTPTNRLGKIVELYENSTVRLAFRIPCPACGEWQPLVLSQVKFPPMNDGEERRDWADRVRGDDLAVYECAKCGATITDAQRREAVALGRYMSEDGKIEDAYGQAHECAETVSVWPAGTRIGVHVNALACLWESLSSIAGAYILAQGNLAGMYSFRTETLGEPFEQATVRIPTGQYAEKCERAALEEGVVPWWTSKLLMTVDTQHDHFWGVVRAWGPGMISARVWHGRIEAFAAIDDMLMRQWANERTDRRPSQIDLCLIDSGGTRLEGDAASRTMEVYRWAVGRRAKVRAIKGAIKPKDGLFIWPGRGWIARGSRAAGSKRRSHADEVRIWHLDTHHFGDELADLAARNEAPPEGTPYPELYAEPWKLNQRNDPEYNQHMSGSIKIVVRRGSMMHEEWVPVSRGTRIDLWDCEVYQVAAAYMAQVHTLPSLSHMEDVRAEVEAQPKAQPKPQSGGGSAWTPRPFRL